MGGEGIHGTARVAKYAQAPDYHRYLWDRLNALSAWLDIEVPGQLRQPGFYVSAGPGINLPAWAGRDVEVFGTPAYRGDLRAYHLVANRIQLYR